MWKIVVTVLLPVNKFISIMIELCYCSSCGSLIACVQSGMVHSVWLCNQC